MKSSISVDAVQAAAASIGLNIARQAPSWKWYEKLRRDNDKPTYRLFADNNVAAMAAIDAIKNAPVLGRLFVCSDARGFPLVGPLKATEMVVRANSAREAVALLNEYFAQYGKAKSIRYRFGKYWTEWPASAKAPYVPLKAVRITK